MSIEQIVAAVGAVTAVLSFCLELVTFISAHRRRPDAPPAV